MVELVTTFEQLEGLHSEWDQVFAQSREASIFNDFVYIRTVWKHFSKPSDRLFVLVLRREGAITAIAPWFITNGGQARNGSRVIRSIGLLEGDKPGILVVDDPDTAWGEILRFLSKRWREWDMLRLDELVDDSPALHFHFPGPYRFQCETKTMHESYFIALHGTWENYLNERGRNVRKDSRRRTRRFLENVGQVEFHSFERPETIRQALHRYVTLEQKSWKKAAGVGVSRSRESLDFYERLLPEMAKRKMVDICLLQGDGIDVAGAILFMTRQKIFGREMTFHPDYASYSPGTMLVTHLIQNGFAGGFLELDLMGMAGASGKQQKNDWATGERKLVQWTVCNRWGMFCSRIERGLGKLVQFSSPIGHRSKQMP